MAMLLGFNDKHSVARSKRAPVDFRQFRRWPVPTRRARSSDSKQIARGAGDGGTSNRCGGHSRPHFRIVQLDIFIQAFTPQFRMYQGV